MAVSTGAVPRTRGSDAPWRALEAELDLWQAAGECATFWWRDDDAAEAAPALRRLLDLSRVHRAPLALAVIPAKMAPALRTAVLSCAAVQVVQHGYAHENHAPGGPNTEPSELGLHRGLGPTLDDLTIGLEQLSAAFADRFTPMLVPPWNRIDPRLVESLPALGYRLLSTFGPRTTARPVTGLEVINTHCDPLTWKNGARFAGLARTLDDLVAHLRTRRIGQADKDEPSGLLSHHLDFDEAAWSFLDGLLARLARHPAARLVAVDSFGGGDA